MNPLAPGSRGLTVAVAVGLVALTAALALLMEPRPAVGPREGEALDGAARIGRVLAGVETGRPAVEAAWQRREGQPPLAGVAQGLAWWALHGPLGTRSGAAGANLLVGLATIALLFLVTRRRFGWLPSAAAALLLVAAPGFLSDLRAARPEPYFGLALVLLVGAAWSADRGPGRALLATLAFVVAVLAAPSGLLLFVPLWLWAGLRAPAAPAEVLPSDPAQSARPGRREGMVALPPFPPWVLLAPVAGLVLLVAVWPWLRGEDAGKRLLEYLIQGHMSHHPPFALLGRVYVQGQEAGPPFWAAPLLWLLRLPLPVLLFAAIGALRGLRAASRLRRGVAPDARGTGAADRDLLLAALVAATLLALHALNGTPWYDGNDGVHVVLPLLALLAAAGLETCVRRLVESPHVSARRLAVPFVAAVVLAGAAARVGAGSAPDASWNPLVGGAAGAAREGLQLRPAPTLPAPLFDWMNATLPPKAGVTVLPAPSEHRELLRRLAAAGVVRDDLFFGDLFNADYVVVTWAPERPDFAETVAFTSPLTPVFRLEHDGVPLALVYAVSPDR